MGVLYRKLLYREMLFSTNFSVRHSGVERPVFSIVLSFICLNKSAMTQFQFEETIAHVYNLGLVLI